MKVELLCSVLYICQTVSMGKMGWWVVIHWLYNTLYCTLQCTVYSVHCTALHFALHFALHISLHIALNTALHIALYILEIHFTVHNRGIIRSNCLLCNDCNIWVDSPLHSAILPLCAVCTKYYTCELHQYNIASRLFTALAGKTI